MTPPEENMDPGQESWKSRERALRKEGRFATIMKAYVNNTSQPSPSTPPPRRPKSLPVRIPQNTLAARTGHAKFISEDTRALTRKSQHLHPTKIPKSEPVLKLESSSIEISTSHALAEQAFATRHLLFNDFPLPNRGAVSVGMEYFLGVCAPPALGQPPGWNWRHGAQSEYTVWYIQNILRSDILFELIVAYAVALRLYLQKDMDGSQAKHAVAFHTQNALHRLRKRLQKEDAYQDDVVVWAVIMLCGTTYILQEIEAFKAHVRGLRQMVALRGGIDSLDRFGFFKRRVINIESSLLATQEHQRQGMLTNTSLIYYRPPFPPSVVRKLSKFPPGFSELAFKISLSENMIDFIEHNLEGLQNPSPGPGQINGVHVTDWILSFPLSKHERLVAVALLTNALCQDRLRRAQNAAVTNYRVQREFSRLVQFHPSLASDHVIWALVALQKTVRFSPELKTWVNELLDSVKLSAESIAKLEARFVPIAQLPPDLERQPDEI